MAKQKKLLLLMAISGLLLIQFETKCIGQEVSEKKNWSFGVESEVMCFINKGYHGSFWLGKNGLRARLVIARATYPDYLNPEGFTNLTSKFYEIEIDRYFGKRKNSFRGLWYALGAGYTRQSIEFAAQNEEKAINLLDLHTGVGYAISIYKGLYINPWLGIDLHLNAPATVQFETTSWKPRKIDPVLGAKIGYSF